jgi:manganese/iron transport system substrate-binding protein
LFCHPSFRETLLKFPLDNCSDPFIMKMVFNFSNNSGDRMLKFLRNLIPLLALVTILIACGGSPNPAASPPGKGKLKVVATTTLVGDVVRNIGGEDIQLDVLLPAGVDVHSFQPTPQDVAKIANADVIFANGAGLETFLQPMLQNAGSQAKVVSVSDGVKILAAPDLHTSQPTDVHTGGDPHTWFDPNNVVLWTQNIAKALGELDPAHTAGYNANAQKYQAQLKDLDTWIRQQVSQIPEANRQLVTDHDTFTYFADHYGFKLVGAVIPGYSSLAEPSAQDLASLEDAIRKLGVKAVFVGQTANPAMSERVTQDTGIHLVTLYGESLSKPDGPAPTYLDFMRYNVNAMVNALK